MIKRDDSHKVKKVGDRYDQFKTYGLLYLYQHEMLQLSELLFQTDIITWGL
jgi:hypothetical protein